MDHMRRGSLDLGNLRALVLDEADEMLRMGFIDDVTWVLEQSPPTRQIALFSATMPPVIRKIADSHLKDPVTVRIDSQTTTADTVNQRFRVVPHHHKLEVLARVLETEEVDGTLIFVRTRVASTELAERLRGRGYQAEALNGDVPQAQREKTVARLRDGRIDVLVATDVAARGLDVERLTHVINYDVPHDVESYVHRIGRTGRAGREGEAILFVTPREQHVVRSIERSTGQKLTQLSLPTTDEVNAQRVRHSPCWRRATRACSWTRRHAGNARRWPGRRRAILAVRAVATRARTSTVGRSERTADPARAGRAAARSPPRSSASRSATRTA